MSNVIDLTDHFNHIRGMTRGDSEFERKLIWSKFGPGGQFETTVGLLRQIIEAASTVMSHPFDDFDRDTLGHLISQAEDHLDDIGGYPDWRDDGD